MALPLAGHASTSQRNLSDVARRHASDSGAQEVFYQDTDPLVTYPAINFKRGFFPAHPDIPTLLVFKP